ncbi:MAG TPA: sugar phosphate nucleotidyltransferase [Parasegetibacter sp.]
MRIKALIFAAGLGTRFKPWTDTHPKALAPVNGKSLLQRNIEYLQKYNITDVVVNVHHFSDQIIEAIQLNKGWGTKVEISDESDAVLETGGGLLKAAPFLREAEMFLTLNADILTNLDLSALLNFHYRNNPLISLAVTRRESSRYLLFDKNLKLVGWRNVKTGEEKISVPCDEPLKRAFSGVAVYRSDVLSLLEESDSFQEKKKFSVIDVYLELAKKNTINGYDHTGDILLDVGKPGSVEKAEELFG